MLPVHFMSKLSPLNLLPKRAICPVSPSNLGGVFGSVSESGLALSVSLGLPDSMSGGFSTPSQLLPEGVAVAAQVDTCGDVFAARAAGCMFLFSSILSFSKGFLRSKLEF